MLTESLLRHSMLSVEFSPIVKTGAWKPKN